LIGVLVSYNGFYVSNQIGEMSRLSCWLAFIQWPSDPLFTIIT